MKILMIGDVCGRPGRRVIIERLPELREQHNIDFVVANVENAAGFGVTPHICIELLSAGVDVMTSGNHVYDKKEGIEYIEYEPRLLRPANYPPGAPGRGLWMGAAKAGIAIAVINLQGRVFMPPCDCPFRAADCALKEIGAQARIILVDCHAEATSEKAAMGRYLDGRVTAVVGTHTHVTTADEAILPGGTAYITDLGMTGPHSGIIGIETEQVLERFLTGLSKRFETATADIRLNSAIIEADEQTGRAISIKRLTIRHE